MGRRPQPEPGETFDHEINVTDPTMTVSKTHLEFGSSGSGLWVLDRFSANGTVIHRPDRTQVVCEPGRRTLVPAGSRVWMGEQFFELS